MRNATSGSLIADGSLGLASTEREKNLVAAIAKLDETT